jgi:hypothetical protein
MNAELCLAEFGPNELTERAVDRPLRILWDRLTGLLVVVLLAASVISASVGDWKASPPW